MVLRTSMEKSPEVEAYEKLRKWYLARLRKNALLSGTAADPTPSSLVIKDRQSLETRVSNASQQRQGAAVSNFDWLPVLLVAIVLATMVLAGVWIIGDEPVPASLIPLGRAALIALFLLVLVVAAYAAAQLQQRSAQVQALKLQEEAIADYASDAFLSLDSDYKLTAYSSAFKRMLFGQLEATKSFLEVAAPEERERVKQVFDRAANNTGVAARVETRIRSGERFTDVDCSIEYSNSEKSFYCILSDISERKEVERLKEQLSAMLSHDVRSPLTSLEFSLALLLKESSGSLSEEGRGVVKGAQNNVRRLIEMINQIMDLSKLDAGRLQLNKSETSVAALIRETLEAIEGLADAKHIDIEVDAPEDLSIQVDADRIVQTLVNIVSNAIKYSPDHTQVNLSVHTLTVNTPSVEFLIADQGPGIAVEHHQAIFERFYMAGPEKKGSTGLGLSIARAIVEAHGGTIGVDSALGAGATFWIRFPLN